MLLVPFALVTDVVADIRTACSVRVLDQVRQSGKYIHCLLSPFLLYFEDQSVLPFSESSVPALVSSVGASGMTTFLGDF